MAGSGEIPGPTVKVWMGEEGRYKYARMTGHTSARLNPMKDRVFIIYEEVNSIAG